MVCKQGKPLSVTKEGLFPLAIWKDSCKTTRNSVTINYFKYVWGELYYHSAEYQEEIETAGAVVINMAPRRIEFYDNTKIKIEFSKGLDTVNYATGHFPLSWIAWDYPGNYLFTLRNAKDGKLLYKDSVGHLMMLDSLIKFLEPGKSYRWTVTAPKAGAAKSRILNYLPVETITKYIERLQIPLDVPEDSAAQYFRIAYIPEQGHYFADAYLYYQKAATTAPDMPVYRDKLAQFKNEFLINGNE